MAVKNICLLAAILALVACFAALSPRLTDTAHPQAALSRAANESDALERFRAARDDTRQMELQQLMSIMTDLNVDEQIRRDAGSMRLNLIDCLEKEATVEGVLMARGFSDVVCTFHTKSVNVLVRADTLTKEQSAIIMELTMRETGQPAANIKIIPV